MPKRDISALPCTQGLNRWGNAKTQALILRSDSQRTVSRIAAFDLASRAQPAKSSLIKPLVLRRLPRHRQPSADGTVVGQPSAGPGAADPQRPGIGGGHSAETVRLQAFSYDARQPGEGRRGSIFC